ncbi:MAG: transporter substrate-binding protein [Brevibacillus sp.]|jgi:iron complex transport system substrate-binding protein|nr:transporter substrate-binding protein [Brevibacillus sp.]
MRSRIFSLGFLMLFTLSGLLAGCGTSAQNAAPATSAPASTTATPAAEPAKDEKRIVKHEMGETEIVGTPQRIVVMDFSFADALATFGIQPVGMADDNDANLIVPEVKEKIGTYTSVGSRYEPNIELLSSLNPDLIIADLNKHKAVYDKLKQIAPTIVLNDHQANYEQMLKNYTVIADAVNKTEEGKKRLDEHNAKLAEVKAKLPQGDAQLKVLPAVVNPTGFFAHSNASYAGSLMEYLGMHDAAKSKEAYPKTNLEQLVALNPDVMFLMKTEDKTIVDEWKANPLWNQINAVKNGKVFEVSRNKWALSRGLIGSELSAQEAITLLAGK